MTASFRYNPSERDEYGYIPDYEKTWVCFTMTVKKAPDEQAAIDAMEFVEWYLYYESDMPCALEKYVKCENGVYTDILIFCRDKSMSKGTQVKELQNALKTAKSALYKDLFVAMPPFILAATKGAA